MFTSNKVMRSLTRRSVRARADAALVGEQFADGTDAAAAEMIDIVQGAFAAAEVDEILHRGDEVFLRHDALAEIDASMPSFWLIL